jgi:hypothetical protein
MTPPTIDPQGGGRVGSQQNPLAGCHDQPRRSRPGPRGVESWRVGRAIGDRVRVGQLSSGGQGAINPGSRPGHAHDLRHERLQPQRSHFGGDTVSVIDSRHCDARDVSRCKGPWPTIKVGKLPGGIAVDEQSDTVYVSSVGGDSVSVFNGATCNATDASGCGQTPATVPVGAQPVGVYADPVNDTVYVTNFGAPALQGGNPAQSTTVSMINSATPVTRLISSGVRGRRHRR